MYFLVFELVSGGELFDEIVTRTSYNERDARCRHHSPVRRHSAAQCMHQPDPEQPEGVPQTQHHPPRRQGRRCGAARRI